MCSNFAAWVYVRGQRRRAESAAPRNLSYVACAALIGLRSSSCAFQQLYNVQHVICSARLADMLVPVTAFGTRTPAVWQQDHSWLELSQVSALELFLGGTK